MPTFAIQRGPTALCTWDTDTGHATFHERAPQQDGMLVVGETDRVTFVLYSPPEGQEHRIFIGDVPLADLVPNADDACGIQLAGQLIWRELPYFESARGYTRILVEAQPADSPAEQWITALAVNVYVSPSKLGEDRYQSMAEDLQDLSRSLLVDLYGKSQRLYDLRFAREGRACQSREQELDSITAVLDSLGALLPAIGQRPASRVDTVLQRRSYWGSERLNPRAIARLSMRGVHPAVTERPFSTVSLRRMETFDISEHRVIQAFLDILIRRASYCAEAARRHIRAIASEQHLRHVRLRDGPTIYESVDLPRVRKLEEAIKRAGQYVSIASAMKTLPYLRDVRAELAAVRGGAFQRSPEYRVLWALIRKFLLANAVWYEGDDMLAVTKLTSRLFEQWGYLRIVEAFRTCGLDLREWNDALRQNVHSRFILDFDRGLLFEGILSSELRLRLRYEPWILGERSATQAGETLCRGSLADVAWCPDILIECLRRDGDEWNPVYGIVLDCKYTLRIQDQHWNQTSKYLEIRNTRTKRQVVRQLWLVSPGEHAGITSEDPAVRFDRCGPSSAPDEAVRLQITASPGASSPDAELAGRLEPFDEFAEGTINYLRRYFGAGTAGRSMT